MTMLACRCGPRPQAHTFTVNDAVRRAKFDPTGTLDIRAKFRREMDAAWSKLHRLVLETVDRNDALGLAGVTASTIDLSSPFLGYDKVKSFQDWIDAALNQVVLVGGAWTAKYIQQAAERAIERAQELTGGDVGDSFDPNQPRDPKGSTTGGQWKATGNTDFPKAGPVVDGLRVLDDVPNTGSISSSLDDYTVLRGIREVSMAEFENQDKPKFHSASEQTRTEALAEAIKESGEIKPLIVVVEESRLHEGAYILEGGHRFDALKILGKKSFPAMVVIDHYEFKKTGDAKRLMDGALDRVRALESLTVVELQGVMEAVSQQAVRAFTQGMLAKQRPSQVARSVAAVINAIGTIRGRMVVSTMIVKTFTAVTLDAFRSAGVTHVGMIPESLRGAKAVGDAARKTQQARGKGGKFRPYTKMPSAKKIREIIKAEQERVAALSMVEVLTAGDELVCQACEDISDDGPYLIDEAEGLIPAHANCRCAFVPSSDERFAKVQKDSATDFNPLHEPAGSEKGGEFASGVSYAAGDLTDDEKNSLKLYAGDGYKQINTSMRSGHTEKTAQDIERISAAIGKSKISNDVTLYRGAGETVGRRLRAKDADELVGKELPVNSFQSTTSSLRIAQKFEHGGRAIIRIHVAAGTPALNMRGFGHESEDETLLGPGKFKIIKVTRGQTRTFLDVEYAHK